MEYVAYCHVETWPTWGFLYFYSLRSQVARQVSCTGAVLARRRTALGGGVLRTAGTWLVGPGGMDKVRVSRSWKILSSGSIGEHPNNRRHRLCGDLST